MERREWKRAIRRATAIALCGAVGVVACGEQEEKEAATRGTAPSPAASAGKQPSEPAPVAAAKKAPTQDVARLDEELGEASKRIDKLREDAESADGKALEDLEAARSKISKELDEVRTAAGEQWQAGLDRLEAALEDLRERLDRLEKSDVGAGSPQPIRSRAG